MSNNYEINTRDIMSDAKFYEGYSRWLDDKGRYETWGEAVDRVMDMHRDYYKDVMTPELETEIDFVEDLYKQKRVLGAQRALQFGGEQLFKNPMRMFNCTNSYCDRAEFFGEAFYILLSGAGVGFSIQKHHVAKLSKVAKRKKNVKIFVPDDSIEGWADCVDVLLSSFFVDGGKRPEYQGHRVYFDLSKIRPKGAMISGGFKAPGPDGLRRALDRIEALMNSLVEESDTIRPIQAYDIVMHSADAVLSGGVRRSATIALFSDDDEEMMTAKTGNWFRDNPQRGRSNNSAVMVRSETSRSTFRNVFNYVKSFGEPGFYFVSSTEHGTNPCVEIGMLPFFMEDDGTKTSGWQGCNLCEINGNSCIDFETFLENCRAAAIMGTLQAGYTKFSFVSETTRKIFDREALLGVSITGWMNSPDVLFNEENLKAGAELVKKTNRRIAKIIGINPAARTTCTKPSGNASVILKTASGIHAEHAPRYLRHVQLTKDSEVAQLILKENPYMVEESVWSAGKTDISVAFPVISPEGSMYRSEMKGIDFLEKVRLVQNSWVEYGTDESLCVDPTVRHNVSNTVTVPDGEWDAVADYIYDNRDSFSGVSLLADSGDKDYNQAPNAEVLTEDQIVEKYGRGAIFASGLIVDSFKGFDNLWDACMVAQQDFSDGGELSDMRADWVRRFKSFAKNYFGEGEYAMKEAEYCLKDVHYLHKWTKIQQNLKTMDFMSALGEKKYTEVDTIGAAACQGGGCEIDF